jgi:phage head maturation protease
MSGVFAAAAMNFHKLLEVLCAQFPAYPAARLGLVPAYPGVYRTQDIMRNDLKSLVL